MRYSVLISDLKKTPWAYEELVNQFPDIFHLSKDEIFNEDAPGVLVLTYQEFLENVSQNKDKVDLRHVRKYYVMLTKTITGTKVDPIDFCEKMIHFCIPTTKSNHVLSNGEPCLVVGRYVYLQDDQNYWCRSSVPVDKTILKALYNEVLYAFTDIVEFIKSGLDIEYFDESTETWTNIKGLDLYELIKYKYFRIKKAAYTYKGQEYIEPNKALSTAFNSYYVVDLHDPEYCVKLSYDEISKSEWDFLVKSGLVYTSYESARAHGENLVELNQKMLKGEL